MGRRWDPESVTKIIPECDIQLRRGAHQPEESITAVASPIALCTTADLAFGNLKPNVPLRAVCVQRDLGPIQRHQQFGLIGVQPPKQTVEGDEAGTSAEDPIEAGAQFATPPGGGVGTIGLEIGIEPPDQRADALLGGAVQRSVKASSLCTSRSACTQHRAWRPTANCPASSLTITVRDRNP